MPRPRGRPKLRPFTDLPIAKQPPADEAVVFLTYISFLGDSAKTAAAMQVDVASVEALANSNGWHAKVDELRVLGREGGADQLARELNRVRAYTQSMRLHSIVDRVIRAVSQDDESFLSLITNSGKDATNTSCKAVTELVKAAEIVQNMLYRAVGDSLGERASRTEPGGIATDLLKALATMGADGIAKPVPKVIDVVVEPTTGPG